MKHEGLRALLAGCLGVVLFGLVGCSENDRPLESPVRLDGSIFGSFYQLTVADPLTQGQARELEAGLKEELEQVDQAMSTYRDDSELVIFNQAPLNEWQPLSNELIDVMAISQTVAEASQGAFDVTVGGLVNLWSFGPEARPKQAPDAAALQQRLEKVGHDALEVDTQNMQARRTRDVFVDLSAVAKGHGTDRAAAYLDSQDIEHYLINIGGELAVSGYRNIEQQTPWRIGIEVPEDGRQQAQHVLPLHEVSVATSGDYRNYFEQDGQRFSHTIDPRTGKPIDHRLASVSVVHPSNAWADAWATALMVLGEEEGMALAQQQELKVLMLLRDEDDWKSVASPAFAEHFGAELLNELEIEHGDAVSLGTESEGNENGEH